MDSRSQVQLEENGCGSTSRARWKQVLLACAALGDKATVKKGKFVNSLIKRNPFRRTLEQHIKRNKQLQAVT